MNNTFEKNINKNILNIILKILNKTVGYENQFICTFNSGSSLSNVYLFNNSNKKMYAVKVIDKQISRVSVFKEVNNKKMLEPYLNDHLPNIIYIGSHGKYEILISDCYGINNLYTAIINHKNSTSKYLKIWENILDTLINVWLRTKNYQYKIENDPRSYPLRIKRIEQALFFSKYNNIDLKSIWNFNIIINGTKYFSLKKSFEIIKQLKSPKFGIVCHGDPQPTNIVIGNNENWYFVDWEWSGNNHDFRAMFSHLFGWWPTRMLNLKEIPQFTLKDNNIIINYNIPTNNIITKFQNKTIKKINEMFDINETDRNDINRYLALLYFGDIRFLKIWGKENYFPLLIGEAVKTLNYTQTQKDPNVNNMFTLSKEEIINEKN